MVSKLELPIEAHREEMVRAINENQVVILVGETGSGKTTQLPIYLYEAGFAEKGMIGVTQPRQIAATSVAEFVSAQLDGKVGYKIRFDYNVMPDTRVKFMTDGILLSEIQKDRDLRQYSVIVVDEAHERSRNIDFVLGLLKDTLKRRPDLKVVVTSATIDQEKFSRYFWGAPVINVFGRTFPVTNFYLDRDFYGPLERREGIVDRIIKIHRDSPEGDILVFLTGEDEIEEVAKNLEGSFDDMVILPIYAALPSEKQRAVFAEYPGKRKVVVATNIAETSITIDGIVYVIDSGFVKQLNFHPETGIQSLDIVKHSKAGCRQRAGRAGRTRPGVCYCMYTQYDFEFRDEFTRPEILRTSLSSVVLAMEAIGIEDVIGFDFIDQPSLEAFKNAYNELIALGAIKKSGSGLTEIGQKMAGLPLEPKISKMILEAEKLDCVEPVITIAAMISTKGLFYRPKDRQEQVKADQAHSRFKNKISDVLSLLQVWRGYCESGKSGQWCYYNFLKSKSLVEADKIRSQIIGILANFGVDTQEKVCNDDKIAKAVSAGLIYSLCLRSGTWAGYDGLLNGNLEGVFIFPGSFLFHSEPRCFVTASVRETKRRFAHLVTEVKTEWLPELVPGLCSFGEEVLIGFDPETSKWLVQKMLFICGKEIDYISRTVDIEEAIKIQDRNIRKAREKGWIDITFRKSGYNVFAERGNYRYEVDYISASEVEDGEVYYCSLERGCFKDRALKRFQVFKIRPPKAEKVSRADLSGLAAHFNSRR